MRSNALLIAGYGEDHVEMMRKFAAQLRRSGCCVRVTAIRHSPLIIMQQLRQTMLTIDSRRPFLLSYFGHGAPHGWGHRASDVLSYSKIAPLAASHRGPLLVINNTCYGLRLLDALRRFRSPRDTAFIAPWDSDAVSFAGYALNDLATFWPKRKMPEEAIGKNYYCTDAGDIEVPILQRWGVPLDHLFFPRPV